MINFEALLKGILFGFVISSPILVANYFINKRLDALLDRTEKLLNKDQQ
jgi:hypothetical protein